MPSFWNSLENLRGASVEEMTQIDGIGEVIATSVHDYFENEHNQKLLENFCHIYILKRKMYRQEASRNRAF